MIVLAKLKCPGCGHSGTAEWNAYRPKFLKELKAVSGRFIAGGGGRNAAFRCEGCRCIAETTEDLAGVRA